MNELDIKTELYNKCKSHIEMRLDTILKTIASNQEALNSETKSSAGDKHETGRAMLQLEMEKASQQLKSVTQMKAVLNKISIKEVSTKVRLGSLVETTKGTYFLAISVGQLKVANKNYFVISSKSPIGTQLLGKQVEDKIPFNNAEILNIY